MTGLVVVVRFGNERVPVYCDPGNMLSEAEARYTTGTVRPNYPVPALITQVRFWPDLVTLHYQDNRSRGWLVKSTTRGF